VAIVLALTKLEGGYVVDDNDVEQLGTVDGNHCSSKKISLTYAGLG
jgi:hypothetical protein